MNERPGDVLRRPVPGPLFRIVKVASWVELGLFAILLIVWLAPGLEDETFYAGLAHGIGFIALALLIWVAVLRHEAPVHPARRDPDPGRPGRQRDRDRLDRAARQVPASVICQVDTGTADGSEWLEPRRE